VLDFNICVTNVEITIVSQQHKAKRTNVCISFVLDFLFFFIKEKEKKEKQIAKSAKSYKRFLSSFEMTG